MLAHCAMQWKWKVWWQQLGRARCSLGGLSTPGGDSSSKQMPQFSLSSSSAGAPSLVGLLFRATDSGSAICNLFP